MVKDKIVVLVASDLEGKHIDLIRKVSSRVEVIKSAKKEEIYGLAPEIDVLLAGHFDEEFFKRATRLKWVHFGGAGVDGHLFPAFVESSVICTNSRGIHRIQMSEYVLGIMLALSHRFHTFLKHQYKREHPKLSDILEDDTELHGKTLGIIGLGNIGYETARKARAFDMRVVAVKRNPEGLSGPEGYVDQILPLSRLSEALAQSDYVVMVLPLTSETYRIMGEKEFRAMKRTAFFINIGRGKTVDENALIKALQEGWIAGAGLDVTEVEPPPLDSPLYDMENVILTLHTSGNSPVYNDRMVDVFCQNLARFCRGEELMNIVDKRAGY